MQVMVPKVLLGEEFKDLCPVKLKNSNIFPIQDDALVYPDGTTAGLRNAIEVK